MAGRKSRDKGNRRELEFAALCGGQRVPLSGAHGGPEFGEDVLMPNGWRAQVKSKADGFKTLYTGLGGADVLALKADRRPWLIVMTADQFLEVFRAIRKEAIESVTETVTEPAADDAA